MGGEHQQHHLVLAADTPTATEYALLRILSLNAGRSTMHETLLRKVWGEGNPNGQQAVRTYMKKLRASSATAPHGPPTSHRARRRLPHA